MSNYQGLTTNHTNLAQNLMNTRNPGKIRAIDVKVRGVGVVSGYSLNPIFSLIMILGVCRALRVKPQKIADQAIFYPANSESTPDNRDFCGTGGAKIHKCNRLLGD
jgi:hypothetical protein